MRLAERYNRVTATRTTETMSDEPDPADLRGQIAELEQRIARSAVVQQQLIATRDDLDRALERFAGLQSYNTRAIAERDPRMFAAITAEAVVELFDLGFGLLWLTPPDGMPATGATGAAAAGIAPAAITPADLAELLATERFRRAQTGLWGAADHPVMDRLGLSQLVASACVGPGGTTFALVIGGLRQGEAAASRGLGAEQLESFTVFAQQIGALLQNRRDQAVIEDQRALAQAANRAKSEFLATVSHELYTPMNGVLGMLQILQDSGPDPEQAGHIAIARQAGERLVHIIHDILDLSTLEAGRVETQSLPFAPGADLAAAAEALRGRCEDKGLCLSVTQDPALPAVLCGDPGRLRQIVTNLIDNAIKFTDQGSVSLTIGGAPLADGHFELALAIRDTGIGIDPADQPRLFTPFTQADASLTRVHGGTGLGLAICRRLLDLMGGRIWVESRPSAGACFEVRLPLTASLTPAGEPAPPAVSTAPAARPGQTQGQTQGQTPRILLVEDNLVGQKVAGAMLERLGFASVVAANGQEALDAFSQGGIAVVLMDVQMPVMDGFEATRRLRALEAERGWPRTPVLALTANTLDDDRDACVAAGMDDFIGKPLSKAGLQDVLARWVGI